MKVSILNLLIFYLLLTTNLFSSTAQIRIHDEKLTVEIAKKTNERAVGLMGRKSLPDGSGMLFIFETPEILSFWMKNTKIPLSIAFFDIGRKIINIEHMTPIQHDDPIKVYQSAKPAKYALEVPQGWFEKHNILPKMRFDWEIDFQESGK